MRILFGYPSKWFDISIWFCLSASRGVACVFAARKRALVYILDEDEDEVSDTEWQSVPSAYWLFCPIYRYWSDKAVFFKLKCRFPVGVVLVVSLVIVFGFFSWENHDFVGLQQSHRDNFGLVRKWISTYLAYCLSFWGSTS